MATVSLLKPWPKGTFRTGIKQFSQTRFFLCFVVAVRSFPHTLSSSWLLSRGSRTPTDHVTGEALGTHRLLQLDVFYKVSVPRVLAEALTLRIAKVEKARPCAGDRGVLLLSLSVGPRPVVFFIRTQFRPWAGLCPWPRTCVACAGWGRMPV